MLDAVSSCMTDVEVNGQLRKLVVDGGKQALTPRCLVLGRLSSSQHYDWFILKRSVLTSAVS